MTRLVALTILTGTALGALGILAPNSALAQPEPTEAPSQVPLPEQSDEEQVKPPPRHEIQEPRAAQTMDVERTGGYGRAVAEDYQVLGSGQELSTQLRFITADRSLGDRPLKFSDLALFDIGANISLSRKLALNASIVTLPKQPSYSDARIFQGASLGLRGQVRPRYALGINTSAGPLLGVAGVWTSSTLFVQHKRRLSEFTAFDLSGGLDNTLLSPSRGKGGLVLEVSGHASVLVNGPNGIWGGWVGVGYAVPVYSRGNTVDGLATSIDPMAMPASMKLDPKPRLDFTIGSGVRIGDKWDAYVNFSVVDRGDVGRAETMMPLIDGGFDQRQIVLGLSRRLDFKFGSKKKSNSISQPMMML